MKLILKHPETGKPVFSCHDVVEALGFEDDDPTKAAALQCVGRALAKAYRDNHEGMPAGKLKDPREKSRFDIYFYNYTGEVFARALEIAKEALAASAAKAATSAGKPSARKAPEAPVAPDADPEPQ